MSGKKLAPIGQTIEESKKYLQEHWRTFAGMVGVYGIYQIVYAVLLENKTVNDSLLSWIFILVSIVFYTYVESVLIYSFSRRETGPLVWKLPWEVLRRNLWVGFISSILIFGGFLILVIPGIILAIWFAFAMWESTINGSKGLAALVASREKVRGLWWPIFGRALVIGFIPTLVVGVEMFAFGFKNPLFYNIVVTIRIVLTTIYFPFSILFWNLIFQQLSEGAGDEKKSLSSGKKYLLVGLLGYVVGPILIILIAILVVAATSLGR